MKASTYSIIIVLMVLICAVPAFAETDTLNVGFDRAWYAMITTLQQDTISINRYDKSSGTILTDYIETPWNKEQEIAARRLSYMGGWDRSVAIWKTIRYKFEIRLAAIDSMQTNVKIEPRIYVYESNTTECMHHFSSTG
ncbi:hypothetical protein GF337_18300, partial [candidate division KSB1 bacterium]|nr:hypothetical protein [candidate division KSB1 bacterium]